MVWDADYDVKEYRPRKRRAAAAFGNSIELPGGEAREAAEAVRNGSITERSGGVMMSTSEILDFSEGSDSYAF